MNIRPVPANTLLDDFKPSRFLKVTDLLERWKVQQIAVTICRVTEEETTPNPKDIDEQTRKPRVVMQKVLYFKGKDGAEFPRGYLLSAQVDIESLKAATGARTAGELIGKKITIHVGEHKRQAVLRIAPTPPADGKPTQPKSPTGEVIQETCKKCGMLADVNPETQRFYSHVNVAGEPCEG